MFDLCIKNGTIVNTERAFAGTLYVSNGKVAMIAQDSEPLYESAKVIDAAGAYVMPGFVDPHSHLNDPGLTNSEDFYTGTCSAAAGGITTVIEHPLTNPLPCTRAVLHDKFEICGSKAVVDFGLFGACTPDNIDELAGMQEEGALAVKAFMPYSPEIPQLSDGQFVLHMKKLAELGMPMVIHCENDSVCNTLTDELVKAGKTDPEYYPQGRPEFAEADAVDRMMKFAAATGAKVHVAHCTIPQGVESVAAAKKNGADVSVETCTHYLIMNSDDLKKHGIFAVCNPPLRAQSTVDKLWDVLAEGKVNFVGSDHCAYTIEEKEAGNGNVFKTPAGITGIQTCFPYFFDKGVLSGKITASQFVAMSSANAAKRYGMYPVKGALEVGSDADIVILNPNKPYHIEKEKLFYMIPWSPLIGNTMGCTVEKTIVRGTVVYEDGKILVEKGYGKKQAPIK